MIENFVHTLLFYLFSAIAVFCALATVCTPRILRAAIYLMGVLGVSAGFYILLGAEFLAGVQILVYVGGIVVLLVFAVMLTRSSSLLEQRPTLSRRLVAFLLSASFFGISVGIFVNSTFNTPGNTLTAQTGQIHDSTAAIGRAFLDQGEKGFVLPFEIISLLLLAALIGGIVIARKTPVKGGQ
ncbi:NADH-quinone oxidoreductase subunit J [Bdellovibrionota bacterium FG-2]